MVKKLILQQGFIGKDSVSRITEKVNAKKYNDDLTDEGMEALLNELKTKPGSQLTKPVLQAKPKEPWYKRIADFLQELFNW